MLNRVFTRIPRLLFRSEKTLEKEYWLKYSDKNGPLPFTQEAPSISTRHKYGALFACTVTWLWVFHRMNQDHEVFFGKRLPWEHTGEETYNLDEDD